MAEVNRTIFVKVVTLDPVSSRPIPVPDVRVKVQHRVPFWFDTTLSQGTPITGSDGITEVVLRFEENDEANLNPYFILTLPEGLREVSSGELDPSRPSFTLPGEWESRHDNQDRIRNLPSFSDRNQPFTVYIGLAARLHLSYSDFREGRSNPIALPENTVELLLIDEDIFFDDTLKGLGYHRRQNRIIPLGKNEGDDLNEDRYPYFDVAPTVPYVMDLSEAEAAQPRAWIDPPGAPLGILGGGSFGQVGLLAVDAHGFVFMVDPALPHPVIHRFYPDGTLCETIATWQEGGNTQHFQQPRGLTCDRNRRLMVTDGQAVLVFRLNDSQVELSDTRQLPEGAGQYRFSHRWEGWAGDPIEGDKSFGEPQGIAILPSADGREELLAVADVRGGVFSAVGVHVFVFSSSGSLGPETLGHRVSITLPENGLPTAVAGNQAGQLIVASRSQHRVSSWQLQTSGIPATATQIWQVGSTAGNSNSQFDQPVAVAVDGKHGVVYVADANNRRVQLLNEADGAFLATWDNPYPTAPGNPFGPSEIALDPRSEIYLADTGNQRVIRATPYAANGTPLAVGTLPRHVANWTPRSELPHFNQPAYVHLDQQGHLWVSDTGNNRVLNYLANPVTGEFQLSRTITGLNTPTGIATAPNGEVFIVEHGANQITQLGATDSTSTTTTPNPALNAPRGIAFAVRPNGPALYVADTGNNRVLRINADGTTASLDNAGVGSALNAPEDVAVDSQGRLIVADTGNNRLVRFNPDDGFDQIIRLNDPSYGLEAPNGLSITPDAQLLITDRRRQRVIELSVLEAGRSVSIGLRRAWDLHRFVPQAIYSSRWSQQHSRVRFASGLRVEAVANYFGSPAWRVVANGNIELLEESTVRQTIAVKENDVVLVQPGQVVVNQTRIAILSGPTVFNADLARRILLAAPGRAVLSPAGVLAIADTEHHRVRLLRIHTALAANLFDLGLGLFEGNPDIYLRSQSRFDWRQVPDTRLRVAAGPNVTRFGNATEWKTVTQDEYSADTYRYTNTYSDQTTLQARNINALKVMRQVQRWMVHTTRTDVADQRWGGNDGPDFLAAELLDDEDRSYHRFFRDVISLGAGLSGRGHDAWDDSVVAHEMGHWIFDYSLLRPQMEELRSRYPGSEEHFSNYLYEFSIALVEGYAEYIELFWGSQYAPTDRLRGYASFDLNQLTPQRAGLVERPPSQTNDLSPVDLYHQRNLGLLSEGYFANTLWQIHHAVANPAIRFADSPSYWWPYNSHLSNAQSQRLVVLLRIPFRQFPTSSTAWLNTPTEHLFRQILAQAHSQHPNCVPLIQQIYEINNQLMPQLRLRRLEGGNPGAAVSSSLSLAPEAEVNLVTDLRDATGANLVGHNLMFQLEGGGSLTLVTPAATPNRGSTIADSFGSGYTDQRPTNAQGEVRFTYRAPAASADPHRLKIAYRPYFTFGPPSRDDSREVALQKLYMQALHQVGPTHPLGFEATLTVEVNLS
jgi:streptogramin lyase